jgi:hypothetical protein
VAFPPAPALPQAPQFPPPPARRRRRWPWFVGIGLAIWLGAAYYFYLDNERTFAEARNRGVDILSTDEKTGVVTARDKQTGKIITMDFNDVGRDGIRPGAIGMPSWVPSYPNAADSEPPANGSFSLSTPDPVADAAGFYEAELGKAGMTVTRRQSSTGASPESVTITATDTARNRSVTVAVKRRDSGSSITITTGNK